MRVEFGAGPWCVVITPEKPKGLDESRLVVDRLGEDEERPQFSCVVSRAGGAPSLLVMGRYRDGFSPGVHVIPETDTLLVGTAESVAAYDLPTGQRRHLDMTPYSFVSWKRHGELVVMCGEVEVAAYDLQGKRVWAAPIEPPWDYGVSGETMFTIVMGHKTEFPLASGPTGDLVVSR